MCCKNLNAILKNQEKSDFLQTQKTLPGSLRVIALRCVLFSKQLIRKLSLRYLNPILWISHLILCREQSTELCLLLKNYMNSTYIFCDFIKLNTRAQ
jgi:hypothetical protein